MFGPGKARTGIDIGTGSVKLVRGEGSASLERITHVGVEDWDPPGPAGDVARAAAALGRLLARLHLGGGHLGRIAVAVGGDDSSFREVILPSLSEVELRQALPFEAKKHLFLESMSSPVLDCQILGPAPPGEDGGMQIRVLLAAAPASGRDFPLHVLARAGLEPEVVDLEPLAALNALLAVAGPEADSGKALGLLDLGGRHAVLHITGRDGGVVSRPVGPGAPAKNRAREDVASYAETIVERVRETLTFYRGRHRAEVAKLFLAGGGIVLPGLSDLLIEKAGLPAAVFDPLNGFAPSGRGAEGVAVSGPRFVTACGLCRWWDGAHV